jgi:hypothetical protein
MSINVYKNVDKLNNVQLFSAEIYVPDPAPVIAGRGPPDQAGIRDQAVRGGREAGPLLLSMPGLFNPVMRELVEMNYFYETPVLLDDAKLQRVLGTIRRTSYDDGIHANVEAVLKTPVAA